MRIAQALLCWLTIVVVLPTLGLSESVSVVDDGNNEEQTCGWDARETCGGAYKDPALQPMQVNLDDGTGETFYAYVVPDIATFYNETEGSMKVTETKFRGLMGKFINMSRKPVAIHWQSNSPHREPTYIAHVEPFGAAGTATYPGHHFLVTEVGDSNKVLDNFHIAKENSLYVYNPFGSFENAKKELSKPELVQYKLQNDNLAFNKLYERFTGRQWLALYRKKNAPRYPIWPADSFGQTHTVVTKETHLLELPPDSLADKTMSLVGDSDDIREELKKYKGSEETLTLNMTVLSVAPRAFEIRNFLSEAEVHHILEVATGMKLSQSTTKAGTFGGERKDDGTRTSRNSWISRMRSPVIDSIIR
jgi:hypothetical protein